MESRKMVQMNLFPDKNKYADIENGHMDTGDGEGKDGSDESVHIAAMEMQT